MIMNDHEIREALCDYFDNTRLGKFRVIDELVIRNSRADIVVVTEEGLTGYEIKGDADSYIRLPKQIVEYDIFFQKNYLVVGDNHKKTAVDHVPPYWGIICISGTESPFKIEIIREAELNPKFNLKKQLSLLWRKELVNIIKRNSIKKYSGKTKAFIRKLLLSIVPHNVLKKQICEELFERDWTLKK